MALLALLGWTAACSGGSSTPTARPQSGPTTAAAPLDSAGIGRFYSQRLHWRECTVLLRCASLTVPVDYAKPSGPTMRVAVIRYPARQSRQGSLIVNPGGPGGSGVDFVKQSLGSFSSLTDHYDLVSFDPRGVGASRPVRCVSSQQLDAFIGADPVATTPAQRRATVRQAKRFAAACQARNGSYLEHVATIDAARDMDVLRAALGDRKLTYYGASYGTFLGAKYAQLFPHRIRAMVLDGAVDPTVSTLRGDLVQARGFETDLDDFLASCVRAGCPLGTSQSQALAGLRQLMSDVAAHPLTVGDRQLTAGTFFEGLAAGLYSPSTWPTLRVILGQVKGGNGRGMLLLSDALSGRRPDGSYNNLVESNLAISCIDGPAPRSPSAYWAAAKRAAKVAPVFGPAVTDGSLPCAFWPARPVEGRHAVHAPGAPPILVIGTTRDPATPYVWAQSLAHQLDSGVLLTYEGDGHTAFTRGDGCIVAAVKSYVESLRPPKPGTRCS